MQYRKFWCTLESMKNITTNKFTYIINIKANEIQTINSNKIKTTYTYNFGRTKNIELQINMYSHAIIQVNMTKKYEPYSKFIETDLFKDSIRKVFTIYLLVCNQTLNENDIKLEVFENTKNNQNKVFSEKINIKIYSIINDKLKYKIKEKWEKNEIENLLKITKSNNDFREIALINFLISKNKEYQLERFFSLWMSFNGMYNYLNGFLQKKNIQEAEQITNLQEFLGYPPGRVFKSNSKELASKIKPIIRKYYNGNLTKDELENANYKSLAIKIEETIKNFSDELNVTNENVIKQLKNLTAYTYLLTQLTYNFRCEYFHASKHLSILSLNTDYEIIYFEAINDLLEDFIEKNLHCWFNETKEKEFQGYAQTKNK